MILLIIRILHLQEITIAEIFYGVGNRNRVNFQLTLINYFVHHFEILPVTNAVSIFAKTKLDLENAESKPTILTCCWGIKQDQRITYIIWML